MYSINGDVTLEGYHVELDNDFIFDDYDKVEEENYIVQSTVSSEDTDIQFE